MELPSKDDPSWAAYRDGYGNSPCAITHWIHNLYENGPTPEFWSTLWSELHHQGDIGEASYAIIPFLVDYFDKRRLFEEQLFHFAVVVDLARTQPRNPTVPKELDFPYAKALRKLAPLGTDLLRRGSSPAETMVVAAAVALQAGDELLARAYLEMGHAEAQSFLREQTGYEDGSADA